MSRPSHESTERRPTRAIRRSTETFTYVDLFVVAVVAVLSVIDTAAATAEGRLDARPAGWFAYALVIAGSLSLLWRRRVPIAVLGVVTTLLIVFWLRDYGASLAALGLPALYAVAAHAEHRRRAWWAMGVACAALLGAASVSLLDRVDGFAWLVALSVIAYLIGAIAAGVLIRNRERIFVDTERRAAAAEADRAAAAERAAATERSRIAREMHDVVAHGLSVVAVQAAAGCEIVHADPDKAAEVFARIETVGRESLTELRRMLGVLRGGADIPASLSPQPGIADIAAAVAASSATGVSTTLVVDGRQRAVAPGIELAAYRIVQEALTNVRKHAGTAATATVRVAYEPDALAVEVTDDGRGATSSLAGSGTGHGLIGMRERVEVYGGTLVAGPQRGGGYAVRASLPLDTTRSREVTLA